MYSYCIKKSQHYIHLRVYTVEQSCICPIIWQTAIFSNTRKHYKSIQLVFHPHPSPPSLPPHLHPQVFSFINYHFADFLSYPFEVSVRHVQWCGLGKLVHTWMVWLRFHVFLSPYLFLTLQTLSYHTSIHTFHNITHNQFLSTLPLILISSIIKETHNYLEHLLTHGTYNE